MSGRRSSTNDYPEHLNPFYEGPEKWYFWGKVKRSSSLSGSLKDLRNTLTLRSFRGHKKSKHKEDDSIQIRNHTAGYTTLNRQTLPVYRRPQIQTSTPLLPRSRFSERVRKSSPEPQDSTYDSSKNPFENDETEDSFEPQTKAEESRKRVRRRKRKAPLPPGVKDSSWSLTSLETDNSSYPASEISDLDMSELEKPMAEIREVLQSFTKEIEKMTDNTNNNLSQNTSDEYQNHLSVNIVTIASVEKIENTKEESKLPTLEIKEIDNGKDINETIDSVDGKASESSSVSKDGEELKHERENISPQQKIDEENVKDLSFGTKEAQELKQTENISSQQQMHEENTRDLSAVTNETEELKQNENVSFQQKIHEGNTEDLSSATKEVSELKGNENISSQQKMFEGNTRDVSSVTKEAQELKQDENISFQQKIPEGNTEDLSSATKVLGQSKQDESISCEQKIREGNTKDLPSVTEKAEELKQNERHRASEQKTHKEDSKKVSFVTEERDKLMEENENVSLEQRIQKEAEKEPVLVIKEVEASIQGETVPHEYKTDKENKQERKDENIEKVVGTEIVLHTTETENTKQNIFVIDTISYSYQKPDRIEIEKVTIEADSSGTASPNDLSREIDSIETNPDTNGIGHGRHVEKDHKKVVTGENGIEHTQRNPTEANSGELTLQYEITASRREHGKTFIDEKDIRFNNLNNDDNANDPNVSGEDEYNTMESEKELDSYNENLDVAQITEDIYNKSSFSGENPESRARKGADRGKPEQSVEANNNEYITNGSCKPAYVYKENKFPVEEVIDNGNKSGDNSDKIIERCAISNEKQVQEQAPVPKVRKKKFSKSKLLGFFSAK